MKDQLVSFETAWEARERGFDEPTSNHYRASTVELEEHHLFTSNSQWSKVKEDKPKADLFSAPTQSLLQRWLREKHGKFVYLLPNSDRNIVDGEWGFQIIDINYVHTQGNRFELDEIIGTYEEALEEGLLKALKEIGT
jgi:hypothetical protein